jgi:hypothetical protein
MTPATETHHTLGRHVPRTKAMAHKRAVVFGVGVSALFHIVAILLYSVVINEWGPGETVLAVIAAPRVVSGMRVVRIIEIGPSAPTPEPPERIPEPTVESQFEFSDDGAASSGDFELEERGGGVRAADVLRVRSSDTRLWREALPEAFALSDAERMQLELAGRLEEWADSVAIVVAAEYALTDWTKTDDQGRRWGVSPGKLHLGDTTIPLPFYFSGSEISTERAEAARRAWEDQDILNGANGQALRASWSERAEAIRRRQDRDRSGQDNDRSGQDKDRSGQDKDPSGRDTKRGGTASDRGRADPGSGAPESDSTGTSP